MKKQRIIVLIISLCLSLFACTQVESNETIPSFMSNSPTVSTSIPLAPEINVEPSYEPLMIDNYTEYLAFLENTDLPKTFIPYEEFSSIGEFDQFMCLTNAAKGDYGQCMYTLIDASGWKLTLYVENRTERWTINESKLALIPSMPENTQDYRSQPIDKEKYLYNQGILYTYVNGKLMSSVWYSETAEFTLCNTNGEQLGNYPTESAHSTFVSKILTKSELQNALNTLPNSIFKGAVQ
jgi:hypothetical protein